MEVASLINSVFNSVTYVLSEPAWDEVWLVDCGDVEKLDPAIPVAGVLLTHTHFDHIYGLDKLLEKWPDVKVFTNAFGEKALQNPRWNLSHYYPEIPDIVIDRMDHVVVIDQSSELEVFGRPVTVKEVPGHDKSCLAFILDGKLFTGDAYIPGRAVVRNFPGSDKAEALVSQALLQGISGLYELYPGHPCKTDQDTDDGLL